MTDPIANSPSKRSAASHRGRWTIAAIFAVAFAVLAGLYVAPRDRSPAVPAGLIAGWPDRPVTFVVLDAGPLGPRPELVAEAVLRAAANAGRGGGSGDGVLASGGPAVAADVVLLIDVEASMVPPVAEALKMQGSFHPQLYQRARRGRANVGPPPGVCLLSRLGLYAGAPVRKGGGPGEAPTVGVTATAGVDGRRFDVTCLDVRQNADAGAILVGVQAGLVGGAADGGLFATLDGVGVMSGPATVPTTATSASATTPEAGERLRLEVVYQSANPPTLVARVRPSPVVTRVTRPTGPQR